MQDDAEGSRDHRRPGLSHWQRSVLVGTLLGDGCLAKHGRWHRLHVKHKAAHRGLAEFKRQAFGEFVSMALHEFDQVLAGRRYPSVQFATRAHPELTVWHERFYRDGRKIVPAEIGRWMTPMALAVWFMDDGAADHRGVTFQTHGFEVGEVQLLRTVLGERFDLAASLRRNKGRWVLYVPASSMGRLREHIGSLILPELRYKMATGSLTP